MENSNKKNKYSLFSFLENRFADPISGIRINDHYIVTGTMMGKISLFSIDNLKNTILTELSTENISDVSFDNEREIFNVAVGDEEIIRYSFSSYPVVPLSSIKNYNNEMEHNKNCENAYILLSSDKMFRVQLSQPEEGNVNIINIKAEVEIKDLPSQKNIISELEMTNYSVPLDFDGERFAWVEFLSGTERQICVADVLNLKSKSNRNDEEENSDNKNKNVYKHPLDKKFGHISYCKILPGNRVFIVRSLNVCEIRELNDNFTLKESFEHIGDEVYAVDICYNFDQKIEKENIENHVDDDKFEKYNDKKNNLYINVNDNSNNNNVNNMKKETENNKEGTFLNNQKENSLINKENNNLSIITLDIDGNVNLYQNKSEKTLFNLYDIKGISQDQKDKQFFSMGYAYYIKCNRNFICISNDHGCYIIKMD